MRSKIAFMRSVLLQAVFFLAIFLGISWLKETRLLDTDGSITAPDFHLLSVNQEWMSLDDLKGKPTLLYFWAPWCSVCKVSMPNLQSFFEDNKQDFNVVTIALSYENQLEVIKALESKKMTIPTLFGTPTVGEDYKISAFPTYYILDEEGYLVSKSMGYSSEVGMTLRSLTL